MTLRTRVAHHNQAAAREEEAVVRATCRQSALLHGELARLHRAEAARIASIARTLTIAFGD